jgi:hypothetical protein
MAAFSEFVLILQQIARADLGSAYFPRPVTRTIVTTFFQGGTPRIEAKATLYVDAAGRLTPGQDKPAIPPKGRRDNVGQSAELRSIINASAKSP